MSDDFEQARARAVRGKALRVVALDSSGSAVAGEPLVWYSEPKAGKSWSPGLKGVQAHMTWQDEAWAIHERAGAGLKDAMSVYVDSLTAQQAKVLEAMTGISRAAASVGDALAGVASEAEKAVRVGGGIAWTSVDAAAWAHEHVAQAAEADLVVRDFWAETRTVGTGFAQGFHKGRGSKVPAPVLERRHRTSDGTYAWVPFEAKEETCTRTAKRGRQEAVPAGVMAAEDVLRAAVREGSRWEERLRQLQHEGPVYLPEEEGSGGFYRCEACGSETADAGLFTEMGEWCG